MLDRHFADTLCPMEGEIVIHGLKEDVTVRRDDMGIPYIDARSMEDLAFAIGYVHASDRLNQMIGLKMISRGRLSEMAGRTTIDLDTYIRTLNLVRAADILYSEISEERKALLGHYCNGVNAYMEQYQDALPPGLALSGYVPERWEPIDSISIFVFVNLALSFNLHEEVNVLNIAQAAGHEKTAWFFPVHPDEDVPLAEARKLAGIDLKDTVPSLALTLRVHETLKDLGMISVAASNNWAVSGQRTVSGKSILANDTHLMLGLPSLWNLMHIRCNDLEAAGVCVAGVPSIVAGYNGHIAWGMTMVMADNQDIFLEKLQRRHNGLHYLYKGEWIPAVKREEVLRIRGEEPLTITVYETIHGPLLNEVLSESPKNIFQPPKTDLPVGLSLSWAVFEPGDKSIDAFFNLNTSRSVEEALFNARQIRGISLNMVIADRDNIAWQVTGRYPLRKKGRGLMPSPGWDGEYDWTGFLDASLHPWSLNPPEGFIGTANNRTVPADFPHILSSSWYWPERAERIEQIITSTDRVSLETCMDMQRDIFSLYVPELHDTMNDTDLRKGIEDEIDSWKDSSRQIKAREALEMLMSLDGIMSVESTKACISGALLHAVTHNAFYDELGPGDSAAWKSLLSDAVHGYCAPSDHLSVRGDESPLWDNIETPQKETKARILAKSLADSIELLEKDLGKDREKWNWGRLHTYYFETEESKMASNMGFVQRTGMKLLSPYFNRGPFPAPGDHTTLNVSAYSMAKDFDTWLIPAMRMIVDFSLAEPLFLVNSTGQSDNPASPHYDDGIHEWLDGNYRSMPFQRKNIEKHYTRVLVLKPSEQPAEDELDQ